MELHLPLTNSAQIGAMRTQGSPLSPEIWLRDLFTSKAVMEGGVIRRKARDVERFAGIDAFLREVDRRGFQVAENAGQFVIFCNQGPVTWLTAKPHSSKKCGPKSLKDFGSPERPNRSQEATARTAETPPGLTAR
ncbi:MAG: aspartate aminotransferase [Pseudomonadota bacterium]